MVNVWSLQQYADQNQLVTSGATEHSCSFAGCPCYTHLDSSTTHTMPKPLPHVCCKPHLVVTHTELKETCEHVLQECTYIHM